MAVGIFLPFLQCVCELGFSTLAEITKSKTEQLRTVDEEMRVHYQQFIRVSVSLFSLEGTNITLKQKKETGSWTYGVLI
jgi:hypothetical protein